MEGVTSLKGLTIRTNKEGDILVVVHLPSLLALADQANATGCIRAIAKKREIALQKNSAVYTHHIPLIFSQIPVEMVSSTTPTESTTANNDEEKW